MDVLGTGEEGCFSFGGSLDSAGTINMFASSISGLLDVTVLECIRPYYDIFVIGSTGSTTHQSASRCFDFKMTCSNGMILLSNVVQKVMVLIRKYACLTNQHDETMSPLPSDLVREVGPEMVFVLKACSWRRIATSVLVESRKTGGPVLSKTCCCNIASAQKKVIHKGTLLAGAVALFEAGHNQEYGSVFRQRRFVPGFRAVDVYVLLPSFDQNWMCRLVSLEEIETDDALTKLRDDACLLAIKANLD
ncbi:hypothetical protein Tco_1165057 [Tanacetum coccineum]|uniref:Uncharacterized protein n=1 Tax=Tanacetum coccineum TaxID=301880 RepID=A0ABQ5A296_9ASTR